VSGEHAPLMKYGTGIIYIYIYIGYILQKRTIVAIIREE